MTATIHIIGAGAVGGSMASALKGAGYRITGVTDRNEERAKRIGRRIDAPWTSTLETTVKHADIVIVAVQDRYIETVASEAAARGVAATHQTWLHLSGALGAKALEPVSSVVRAVAACHPALVFPHGHITPIPPKTCFGVDTSDNGMDIVRQLVGALKGNVVEIPEAIRPRYHATTVLASNAVIALLATARDALAASGVDAPIAEKLLITLAESAARNGASLGLDRALTGPIRRGDIATVSGHLSALQEIPAANRLYRALGQTIVALARGADGTDAEGLDHIERLLKS